MLYSASFGPDHVLAAVGVTEYSALGGITADRTVDGVTHIANGFYVRDFTPLPTTSILQWDVAGVFVNELLPIVSLQEILDKVTYLKKIVDNTRELTRIGEDLNIRVYDDDGITPILNKITRDPFNRPVVSIGEGMLAKEFKSTVGVGYIDGELLLDDNTLLNDDTELLNQQ